MGLSVRYDDYAMTDHTFELLNTVGIYESSTLIDICENLSHEKRQKNSCKHIAPSVILSTKKAEMLF